MASRNPKRLMARSFADLALPGDSPAIRAARAGQGKRILGGRGARVGARCCLFSGGEWWHGGAFPGMNKAAAPGDTSGPPRRASDERRPTALPARAAPGPGAHLLGE